MSSTDKKGEEWVVVEEEVDDQNDAITEEEEEFDEEEMKVILAEAKRLRFMAHAFLHPEEPVQSTGLCFCDGCYYDRPSAPVRLSKEEADEQAQILEDAASLSTVAHTYAHPEDPVVTSDPTATARCYYGRPSAPEQLSYEEAEEQAQIMKDLAALRKAAKDFLHPEVGVTHSDPECFGRNYFTRYDAPEQLSYEDAEEQAIILADAAALKKRAAWYLHPELPVEVSSIASTRCYFDRPSAPYDADEIISTSAYAVEKNMEVKPLKKHMETLQALAPPQSKVKATTAIGPFTSSVQSASNVQLFDLEFA